MSFGATLTALIVIPVLTVLPGSIAVAATSSTATHALTADAAPSAPTLDRLAGASQRALVTFTPPALDGEAAVTSYQVSINSRAWRSLTTRVASRGRRTASITKLENGVSYSMRVRARNVDGPGAASTPLAVVPNAPRLGTDQPIPTSEVAVPKHPRDYVGPRAYTTAFATSRNGTWAHPIAEIGARQLTKGEAARLPMRQTFKANRDVLTDAGRRAVRFVATHLRLAHAVSCEGYVDYAGSVGRENALSERRAHTVCQALDRDGADVGFVTRGYGGGRPVVIGGSMRSRAQNGRVVLLILG
jgi:outer membrane protein OmpA-like peptidoglycan-associated protein